MKSLVVYYTRTGHTKKIAEEIAEKLKADVELLIDKTDRAGFKGWMKSGRDGFLKKSTEIEDIKYDHKDYDLVVIGTPVWAGKMAPAIRTYLHARKIPNSAFFCTYGGSNTKALFADMLSIIVDTKLLGKLAIKEKELQKGYDEKMNYFLGKLIKN